jgi:hypothetical protein
MNTDKTLATLQNVLSQIVLDLETNEETKNPLLIIYGGGQTLGGQFFQTFFEV